MFWQGRAKTLRLIDAHQSNEHARAIADAFEACASELNAAFKTERTDAAVQLQIGRAVTQPSAAPQLRCDECDNGVDPTWNYCPWCGETNHWSPRKPSDDAEFGMEP